jgi:uncharacterized protein HemX
MPSLITVITIVIMLGLGIAAGYYLRYLHALSRRSTLELELQEKTLEAEKRAIEIIEKAEAKAEKIEHEIKTERAEQTKKFSDKENHLLSQSKSRLRRGESKSNLSWKK